jgi:hypothetical protein
MATRNTLKQLIENKPDGTAVVYFSLNKEQLNDENGKLSADTEPDAFMAYDSKSGTLVIKAKKITFATDDLTVDKLNP